MLPRDIEAIEKTVSYLDKVSFESLPILPTGTYVLAGLSAKLPVVVKMNELDDEFQPNSQTIVLTDYWEDDLEDFIITEELKQNMELEEDNDVPF